MKPEEEEEDEVEVEIDDIEIISADVSDK